jgi:hypothetical protein
MHPHPQLNPLTASFLQHLDTEEQLLRDALTVAADLYASLRKGDLAPIKITQPRQEQLAAALRMGSDRREAAAIRLAQALGLPPEGLTLSVLAKHLGEPVSTRILAARERLSAITKQLMDFQQRNANLIHHLRSYFRSVLSALTKTSDVPVRYGSSGARLTPGFGAAIKARG